MIKSQIVFLRSSKSRGFSKKPSIPNCSIRSLNLAPVSPETMKILGFWSLFFAYLLKMEMICVPLISGNWLSVKMIFKFSNSFYKYLRNDFWVKLYLTSTFAICSWFSIVLSTKAWDSSSSITKALLESALVTLLIYWIRMSLSNGFARKSSQSIFCVRSLSHFV